MPPDDPLYELEYKESGNGRGYVVVRCADRRPLQWRALPGTAGVFSLRVFSEQVHDAALQDPSFKPGSQLKITSDPENPYDPSTVSVWNADHTLTVGHLARADAAALLRRLSWENFGALSMWEVVENGRRTQLRILIFTESALGRRGIPIGRAASA